MTPSKLEFKTEVYETKNYDFGVSIPLTCYNESPDSIRKCINSIFKQTYNYIELIIINDGPTNSWVEETVLEFLDPTKIPSNIIHLTYIRNPKNMGVVYTKNLGFDLCEQKYIMQFDADFEILSDKYLQYQINEIEANPQYFGIINELLYDSWTENGQLFGMLSACRDLEDLSKICTHCGPPIYVLFPHTSLDNLRYRECIQFDADFWVRFWYKNRNKQFKTYDPQLPEDHSFFINNVLTRVSVINNRTTDLTSQYAANIGPDNVKRFKEMGIPYEINGGVHHPYIKKLPGNPEIYEYFTKKVTK